MFNMVSLFIKRILSDVRKPYLANDKFCAQYLLFVFVAFLAFQHLGHPKKASTMPFIFLGFAASSSASSLAKSFHSAINAFCHEKKAHIKS